MEICDHWQEARQPAERGLARACCFTRQFLHWTKMLARRMHGRWLLYFLSFYPLAQLTGLPSNEGLGTSRDEAALREFVTNSLFYESSSRTPFSTNCLMCRNRSPHTTCSQSSSPVSSARLSAWRLAPWCSRAAIPDHLQGGFDACCRR